MHPLLNLLEVTEKLADLVRQNAAASERTCLHVNTFNHLYESITRGDIDESCLAEIERRHNLFPEIDYRIFA